MNEFQFVFYIAMDRFLHPGGRLHQSKCSATRLSQESVDDHDKEAANPGETW